MPKYKNIWRRTREVEWYRALRYDGLMCVIERLKPEKVYARERPN